MTKKTRHITFAGLLLILVTSWIGFSFFNTKDPSVRPQQHRAPSSVEEQPQPTIASREPHSGLSAGLNLQPKTSSADNLSFEAIRALIMEMANPSSFLAGKERLKSMPLTQKAKILDYITSSLRSSKELEFTLRSLDLVKLILELHPELVSEELVNALKNHMNSSNPMIVRGCLRALTFANTDQSIDLLLNALKQEDASLSALVMEALAQKASLHGDQLRQKSADNLIIDALIEHKNSEQDTVEINTAAIRALTRIGGNKAFEYLANQMAEKNLNLSLKNEIAQSLPKWGAKSEPVLESYLTYLRSLRPESDPLADADRRRGFEIVRSALKQLSQN